MTVTPRTRVSKHADEEAGFSSPGRDLEGYLRKIVATDQLLGGELWILGPLHGRASGPPTATS